MGRLDGKTAVITGGNSGVGAATAKLFAREGAKVVISARRAAALQEVATEIEAAGGSVLTVPTDISREDDCKRLMDAAVEAFGGIDVLINNAGVLDTGIKGIDKYLDEDLEKVLAINEVGTMQCMRAALPKMKAGGSIANVASVAGFNGGGGAAYVASKAAIIGITKHTALLYAARAIRCNAVCPGTILTPMTSGMNPASLDMDTMGAMAKHNDLRGVSPCRAEDVAGILLFLASDESRPVTGQILVTDFGASL